jgi:hypothetical protein
MLGKFKRRVKTKIKNKFVKPLAPEDIRGYRNILKLLYHERAEKPTKDIELPKYYIQVPSLHLDLIIDSQKAEIVNTKQVYPLNLNERVTERAVELIRKEISKNTADLEEVIRGKKDTILNKLYSQIK